MKEVITLPQAIKATLSYFDIFDRPLTLGELKDYLFGCSATEEAIIKTVEKMPDICFLNGLFFLKNRERLASEREEKKKASEALWNRVRKFSVLFALCPFVRMVAVINSLSFNNATNKSDIDLFVITRKKHLWCARFFLKLLTQIFGARAHHEKIAGRFCLSFFVSEEAMDLSSFARKYDPHLAYLVYLIAPVIGKQTYTEFLKANNKWTAVYFKRPLVPRLAQLKEYKIANAVRFFLEKILSIFGPFLEHFFYAIQQKKDLARKKALQKDDGVVMNKKIFKFHELDNREKIADRFSHEFSKL